MSAAWPRIRLGEVLRLDLDKVPVDASTSYPMVGVLSFGRGLFDREPIENGKTSYRFFYRLKPDHIVLSQLFGWEGALALSSEKFAGKFLSPQFPTFLCNHNKLDRQFLGWLMRRRAFWEDLGTRTSGMGDRRRTLTPNALFACEIPLPPLSEQQRIVSRIENLSAQIHKARSSRELANWEAEVLMDSYRRNKFGMTSMPHWVLLGEYVAAIENGKSPATEGRPASDDEWGVLKVGAVSFGSFNEKQNKALPIAYTPPPSFEVKPGDFLMSRANTRELVGACALVRETRPKLMLSDKTFRFVFRSPRTVLPEYLEQVLISPALREQIEREASGTSPTMKNISKAKVLSLLLPPMTLSEQRKIVAELDALQSEVNALRCLQTKTVAELDALLPAILDRAFKGEL